MMKDTHWTLHYFLLCLFSILILFLHKPDLKLFFHYQRSITPCKWKVILNKDAENTMGGARKQQGSFKDNDTYTRNQKAKTKISWTCDEEGGHGKFGTH